MKALKSQLKNYLLEVSPQGSEQRLWKALNAEFGKSESDPLKVPLSNLHARSKPGQELLGEFKRAKSHGGDSCYILGCGLGYGLKELNHNSMLDDFNKILVVSSLPNAIILTADLLINQCEGFPVSKLRFIYGIPSAQTLKSFPPAMVLAPALYQKAEGDFLRTLKSKINYVMTHSQVDIDLLEENFKIAHKFFDQSFALISKEML